MTDGEWLYECDACGYVSRNDEIGREEPPDVCPECGGNMRDATR